MVKKIIGSPEIDRATSRLEGIRGISETLDLGNGVTVAALEASIKEARIKEGIYKQYQSILEEKHAAFEEAEKQLTALTSKVLAAVALKYGKDSVEYEQAGGVRLRDRKRRSSKPKTETSQQQ